MFLRLVLFGVKTVKSGERVLEERDFRREEGAYDKEYGEKAEDYDR